MLMQNFGGQAKSIMVFLKVAYAIGKWQAVDKLHVNWFLSGWCPCLLDTFSLPDLQTNENVVS